MSPRVKYEELNQKLLLLNEQYNTVNDKISSITEEQYKLLQQIIQEEHLFDGTKWELKLSGDQVYLTCQDSRKDESSSLHKLDALLNGSYHYFFTLEEDVEIRFDDNEISIHFEENKAVMLFCKKYKMTISSSTVAGKLQALKRQVNQLEILAHQFNIKG